MHDDLDLCQGSVYSVYSFVKLLSIFCVPLSISGLSFVLFCQSTVLSIGTILDRAIKYAVGMRYASIGLLEYYDAVGFELERAIALNVYPDLCDTKSIQKTTLVGIASGRTGQKAGQGLYDWSEKDEDDFRYRKQAPYFEGVRQWHMPE